MWEQPGSAGSLPAFGDLGNRELHVSLPLAAGRCQSSVLHCNPFCLSLCWMVELRLVGNKPNSGLISSNLFPEGGNLVFVLQSLPYEGLMLLVQPPDHTRSIAPAHPTTSFFSHCLELRERICPQFSGAPPATVSDFGPGLF